MKKALLIIIIVGVIVGVFYIINNKEVIAPVVTSNKTISQVEERVLVEKYVRDNIKTIAPEEPVLGGSWYVTAVSVDSANRTGNMTYEDGHIEGKAAFTYVMEGDKVSISTVQKIMQ